MLSILSLIVPAGEDKVRPEHAELNGITLPASDSFWDNYFPPNGWNCRCTVVQVLKSKNTPTDHNKAMEAGGRAIAEYVFEYTQQHYFKPNND